MRVAISGSHRVGKTTLAEALGESLRGYEVVAEPYHLLEEDGYEFAEMPSIEDFELQLRMSIQSIRDSGPDVVFDRCPLDILAYLVTHRDADAFDVEEWLPRVRQAVRALDTIVFLPIEEPDRVAVPASEAQLRSEVDVVLGDMLVGDAYELDLDVITVSGTPSDRLRAVLAHLPDAGAQPPSVL